MGDAEGRSSLSKCQPLSEIVFHNEFDDGLTGWIEFIGNCEDSLENETDYLEAMDTHPPMLSSATMQETSTALTTSEPTRQLLKKYWTLRPLTRELEDM